MVTDAKMMVKRAAHRQRAERTVETRFVLWSLCRYMIVVSMLNDRDGERATYHGDESNSKICKTQDRNCDAAS